jgi:hypothetical protein
MNPMSRHGPLGATAAAATKAQAQSFGNPDPAHVRFDRCRPGVQAHQFARQHAAQGVEIGAALGTRMLDQPHQLQCGVDKRASSRDRNRNRRCASGHAVAAWPTGTKVSFRRASRSLDRGRPSTNVSPSLRMACSQTVRRWSGARKRNSNFSRALTAARPQSRWLVSLIRCTRISSPSTSTSFRVQGSWIRRQ